MVESLEDRRLLNVDWRNPVDSFDVDNDGSTSPLDALVVINYINSGQPGSLPAVYDPAKPFVNVDGDKSVSPLDVLSVINYLNANGGGTRSLAESAGQFVHETNVTITLGQTSGTRGYRVRIDSQFDTTDGSAALEDLLAVYLVDPKQPTKTLLDRGTNGTALFTLAGTKAEFVPGRVRWDGSVLDINLSDLALSDTGLLKFQLLNSDSDGKTKVTIQPLTNQVDVEGTTSPKLSLDGSPVAAGTSTTLANLTPMANGQLQVGNVRFDASTGKYKAELRLRNDGDSVGRDVAVVFPGLPAGVTLLSPSGTTTAGEPYINLKPAIPRGGLTQGSWSEPVAVEFNNPGQVLFVLKPKVLAAINHAPTLAAIPPLTVMPGGVLNVSLVAADQDGDAIAFSLVTTNGSESLPTGSVGSSGVLTFRPTPSQLGTYQFDVIASDGALEATRSVTLNVVADPITTTRVSGKVLHLVAVSDRGALDGDSRHQSCRFARPVESDFDRPRMRRERSNCNHPDRTNQVRIAAEGICHATRVATRDRRGARRNTARVSTPTTHPSPAIGRRPGEPAGVPYRRQDPTWYCCQAMHAAQSGRNRADRTK